MLQGELPDGHRNPNPSLVLCVLRRKIGSRVLHLAMSAATVSEPFLLSSYAESSAYKKRKVIPLHVSLPSGSDADPFVTVAVQGDGVHILNVRTIGIIRQYASEKFNVLVDIDIAPSCITYAWPLDFLFMSTGTAHKPSKGRSSYMYCLRRSGVRTGRAARGEGKDRAGLGGAS